ncbi:HSF-type DNA-binding domain protein (macronuclear) [Tetrahymena thermophila SB210]|uniref:HSF-type DNA-binding domain protein n=1 Tax=Tetrahymena thermophila (strain SB210) TaxID=312017 RepID=Q23VX2_TETTS|nr:HSF-type DNA-binding domain protein [Tetrahymena thermophila SB210]EAS00733.2 HSF-type DNA-binding domain protein [Tetrahymena thermophila SB210]|eukprot:XP_001020978.2 HSF-type DNA-binding domain protein [Tetrahymena thermophila SB210]
MNSNISSSSMAQDQASLMKKKKAIATQKTRLSVPAFLLKTYEMIENKDYQDIVCWNNDGQSFVIKNINEFSEKVLSNYFKHNNFASFVRQLNMYDFHKIRNENNETEFRHRLFQKGNKNMLIDIKRKSGDNAQEDQSEQGQMSSIDMMEMERIKKDYNLFLSEVMNIKQKYTEQERIMHQMAASIERVYSEKQALQQEFQKFKEEQQLTNDKLYYLQSYLLMGTDQLQGVYQQTQDSALSNLSKKMQQNNNNNNNFQFSNGNNNLSHMSTNSSFCNSNENNNNNNSNNNNNNNISKNLSQLLGQGNSFGQYGNNNLGNGNNILNNNPEQYGQNKQNNLSSSYHSLAGENESVHSQSNANMEHKISKKQDWSSVSQLNKDGENIPICPLPFVQKKKERSQLCEKQINNLVNVFKNVDLKNIQKPDIFNNYLRDVFQSGKSTISEEAINQYTLGSQAKRMFQTNQSNAGRQNLSMFEGNPLKRICGNNNLNLPLGITDGSEKSEVSLAQGLSLFQNSQLGGISNGGSQKQIQLQLQTSFNNGGNNNGTSGNSQGGQGQTGLFSPSYFNQGESSPRIPFNLYPSPNPNSGNNGNGFGNNFQGNNASGLQNFLTSPSPNMSPLLLRDMEEFISQTNANQTLSYGNNQNNGGVSNNGNNIDINKRLAQDLLTSFKTEAKQENKYY